MLRLFLALALFLGATFAQNQTLDADPCKTWRKASYVSGEGNVRITKLEKGNYYISLAAEPWYASKAFCDSHGMKLAVFETSDELEQVKRAFPVTGAYWVGASDIGREPGQFYWSDGSKVHKRMHNDGSKYGAGKETCIFLHSWEDKLDDFPCAENAHFVCEVRPEYQKCV